MTTTMTRGTGGEQSRIMRIQYACIICSTAAHHCPPPLICAPHLNQPRPGRGFNAIPEVETVTGIPCGMAHIQKLHPNILKKKWTNKETLRRVVKPCPTLLSFCAIHPAYSLIPLRLLSKYLKKEHRMEREWER